MESFSSRLLPYAVKTVGDAIRLDSDGKTKDALCSYLASIMFITKSLKDYVWDQDLASICDKDTIRLLKIIGQCQERAADIVRSSPKYEKTEKHSDGKVPQMTTGFSPLQSSPLPGGSREQIWHRQVGGSLRSRSYSSSPTPGSQNNSLPISNADRLVMSLPTPPTYTENARHTSPKSLDQIQNQQVYKAFQRRKTWHSNLQQKHKADYNLGLLRKLVEDKAIERAKSKALQQKLQEQKERLRQKAKERFAHQTGSRKTDKAYQEEIYTRVLEFEEETSWPQSYREKLMLEPENIELIKEIVCRILKTKEHPIGQIMLEMQFALYKEISLCVSDFVVPVHDLPPYTDDAGAKEESQKQNNAGNISGVVVVVNESGDDVAEERKDSTISSCADVANDESLGYDASEGQYRGEDSIQGIHSDDDVGELRDHSSVNEADSTECNQQNAESRIEEIPGRDDEIKVVSGEKQINISAELIRISSSAFENAYEDFEDFMLENLDSEEYDYSPWKTDEKKSKEDGGKDGPNVNDSTMDEILEKDSGDISEEVRRVVEDDDDRLAQDIDRNKGHLNEDDQGSEKFQSVDYTRDSVVCDKEDATGFITNKSESIDEPDNTQNTEIADDVSSINVDNQDVQVGIVDTEDARSDVDERDCDDLGTTVLVDESVDIDKKAEGEREDGCLMAGSESAEANDLSAEKIDNEVGEVDSLPKNVLDVGDDENEDSLIADVDAMINDSESSDDKVIGHVKQKLEESGQVFSKEEDNEELENVGDDKTDEELEEDNGTGFCKEEYRKEFVNEGDGKTGDSVDGGVNYSICDDGQSESVSSYTDFEQVKSDNDPEFKMKFDNIIKEIQSSLSKLHSLLIVAYDKLDMPTGKEQSYESLETVFFKPLWPWISQLFRKYNMSKERLLWKVLRKRWNFEPASFFIRPQYCLSDLTKSTTNDFPYRPAVEELRKIIAFSTPLDKLNCIVNTSKLICQCVDDYWRSKGAPPPSVGCDDLLPILTYVVVKTALSQLVSECHLMEEFIQENYLLGEEGYCLTTLSTAITYVLNLANGGMPGDTAR
eukprot:gene19126-21043_t